jgi:putative tryptophan/tyrosine transport system substrate-binding protein
MTHTRSPALISRRTVLSWGAFATLSSLNAMAADQGMHVPRIGWLGWQGAVGASASALALAAFRLGLRDRGWTEGRDCELLIRDGDRQSSAELAADLLKKDVTLIVAQGPMVFGAKTVAADKPILFSINGDPVEAGLVSSLSRPGGNLTGVTALSAELAGKRVELLKAAVPKGTRLAVVANEMHPGVAIEREATYSAAKRLGLTPTWHGLKAPGDMEPTLAAMARGGADMLLAIPDNLINNQAKLVAAFATARRLPSMSGWSEFVEAGNLLSYGPNPRGYYRQMAVMADRLLRGARASDVAVEQARDLEFVVNTRTARLIGLNLPPELLLRADQRIE